MRTTHSKTNNMHQEEHDDENNNNDGISMTPKLFPSRIDVCLPNNYDRLLPVPLHQIYNLEDKSLVRDCFQILDYTVQLLLDVAHNLSHIERNKLRNPRPAVFFNPTSGIMIHTAEKTYATYAMECILSEHNSTDPVLLCPSWPSVYFDEDGYPFFADSSVVDSTTATTTTAAAAGQQKPPAPPPAAPILPQPGIRTRAAPPLSISAAPKQFVPKDDDQQHVGLEEDNPFRDKDIRDLFGPPVSSSKKGSSAAAAPPTAAKEEKEVETTKPFQKIPKNTPDSIVGVEESSRSVENPFRDGKDIRDLFGPSVPSKQESSAPPPIEESGAAEKEEVKDFKGELIPPIRTVDSSLSKTSPTATSGGDPPKEKDEEEVFIARTGTLDTTALASKASPASATTTIENPTALASKASPASATTTATTEDPIQKSRIGGKKRVIILASKEEEDPSDPPPVPFTKDSPASPASIEDPIQNSSPPILEKKRYSPISGKRIITLASKEDPPDPPHATTTTTTTTKDLLQRSSLGGNKRIITLASKDPTTTATATPKEKDPIKKSPPIPGETADNPISVIKDSPPKDKSVTKETPKMDKSFSKETTKTDKFVSKEETAVTAAAPILAKKEEEKETEESGCYLVYDEDGRKLVQHYSKTRVEGAMAFYTPGEGKKIPPFKYKSNQGRSDLIKNCSVSAIGRKNYHSGWCQFVRSARTVEGTLQIFPQSGPFDVSLYRYTTTQGLQQTEKIQVGNQYSVKTFDAVACIPTTATFFDGMTMDLKLWIEEGGKLGATINLSKLK